MRGSPSYRVAHKLKILRAKLKTWNWNSFGNIKQRVGRLQTEIETMENITQSDWSALNDQRLQDLKAELQTVLRWESDMLFQETRVKWVADGDKNNKFFHAIIKDRRRRNALSL